MTTGTTASAASEGKAPLLADAFLGTWTFQSGSQVASPCLSTPVDLSAKAADVTAGATATDIVADVQGCQIPFTETDATHASLKAQTNCQLSDGTTTYSVSVTSASLSVDANGVLTASASGTADIFCSISLNGTATK